VELVFMEYDRPRNRVGCVVPCKSGVNPHGDACSFPEIKLCVRVEEAGKANIACCVGVEVWWVRLGRFENELSVKKKKLKRVMARDMVIGFLDLRTRLFMTCRNTRANLQRIS